MRYTELDLSSEQLDQPRQDVIPARKLLILSPPRTGSYMLCRHMLNAGLGVPHEYFNDIHMYLMGRRAGIPELADPKWMRAGSQPLLLRYLHYVYAIRTRAGLFAAKIQYRHFHLFLREEAGQDLFRGASLVYLTREDIVAQAVSLHLAQHSGRWSFEKTRLTKPQGEGDARDLATVERMVKRIATEESRWEQLFTRFRLKPLRLTYEQVCADPATAVRQIARRCGAPAETLNFGYDDGGRYPTGAEEPDKDRLAEAFRRRYAGVVASARMPAAPPGLPASPPGLPAGR